MSDKALTRYRVSDVQPVEPFSQIVHMTVDWEMVKADDATREIAKRDKLIVNLRNALVSIEKDAKQMRESSYDEA